MVQAGSKAEAALAKAALEDAHARAKAAEGALQEAQSSATEGASLATMLQTSVAEANSRVAEAEGRVKEVRAIRAVAQTSTPTQATLRVTELEYRCNELQAEAEAAAQRHDLALRAAAEEAARAQRAAVQQATEQARLHGRDEALKSSSSNAAAMEAQARRYEAMTALLFAHLHLLARVVADAQDKIQHRARLVNAMQVR